MEFMRYGLRVSPSKVSTSIFSWNHTWYISPSSTISEMCWLHISPSSERRITVSRSPPALEAKCGISSRTGDLKVWRAGDISIILEARASLSINGGGYDKDWRFWYLKNKILKFNYFLALAPRLNKDFFHTNILVTFCAESGSFPFLFSNFFSKPTKILNQYF